MHNSLYNADGERLSADEQNGTATTTSHCHRERFPVALSRHKPKHLVTSYDFASDFA